MPPVIPTRIAAPKVDRLVISTVPAPAANGRVPVRFTKMWSPYTPGAIAGFSPDMAARLVESKVAHYVREEDASVAETRRAAIAAEAKTPSENLPPKQPVKGDGDGDGLVDIPEGWENEHHMSKISLAKKIDPDAEVKTTADAEKVINAEIVRRKATASEDPAGAGNPV